MTTKIVDWQEWLMSGDPSIQYLAKKYLLDGTTEEMNTLRSRIKTEGFGKRFLENQRSDGHWGEGFYQHKWISTHYTLLDLMYLGIEPTEGIMKALNAVFSEYRSSGGAISCNANIDSVDVCVNGMFLNYACYFGVDEAALMEIIDYLLSVQMLDGGYNCQNPRSGAIHSSLHSTISVLEGFQAYKRANYHYRIDEIRQQSLEAREFILRHHLYKSHRTGEIIHKSMTMLSFPSRWKYDILRGLVYFVDAGEPYDSRMSDAIELLIEKQRTDGLWPVQAKHQGKVHFDMEKTGGPSRFNTLRALRVLKAYRTDLVK